MKGRGYLGGVVLKNHPPGNSRGVAGIYLKPGHYLLSQGVAPLLPSARGGLTARFGMELGVSLRSIGTQASWPLESA